MVEPPAHNPEIEGLNPASTGIRRGKMAKKLQQIMIFQHQVNNYTESSLSTSLCAQISTDTLGTCAVWYLGFCLGF